MKHAFLIFCFAVLAVANRAFAGEPELLPRAMLEEGWIQLFDGETLFGWQAVGDATWEVADGEIRTEGATPGFLMSTTEWANYELHVEFRAPEATNSGVFLRTPLAPKDPATECYELNIAPPENSFPTGSLVGRKRVGQSALSVTAETPSPNPSPQGGGEKEGNPSPRQGGKREGNPSSQGGGEQEGWRTFRLIVWKGWIRVQLDGEYVTDYRDPSPIRIGHIGLQSNSGPVAFRNVRLRPIELWETLGPGNLSMFSTERGERSEFEINEAAELHVTNGPGQIETKDEYANFAMQLECKVNGDGLNSGIFFRALRTGRWAGYESQINNVFKDGDRTKPADFGTGGIYRRQPARRVVADDREWFFKTIVADGPHMAVWVNGYQVSDWTDTRPEKENAREGLRLGPGVIAIQGHDPTTDFWFRNITVAELPR